MSLRDEITLYTELSGNDGNHTPIGIIGAYLDGYEKGKENAQPEQRWIPVSERLPDGQGFYLVSVGAPYKTVRVYEYKPCEWFENENLWKKEDGSYCFNWFVEAWMPLPEPYREEGEQDG